MAGLANPNTMRMRSLQWNGNIQYQLIKGLDAKISIGLNQLEQNDKQLRYKKNTNPLYIATARSTTNQRIADRLHCIIKPQVHYSFSSIKHIISSLIGSTFQKNESKEVYLRGQGFFSEAQIGNISLAENRIVLRDAEIDYRYAAL